jgi:integrase/recombinase XerC
VHGDAALCDVVLGHLHSLELRNLRPSTIAQRGRVLKRTQRITGICLLTITAPDLDPVISRKLSPESRATEISHLRQFYRWAALEGFIEIDPTIRLQRPRLPRRLPRPMGDDDLIESISNAPPRVRLALMLAAYAGLRACEIAQLRGEHVMGDQTPPVLIVAESKGGGMSSVPLHPALRDELARWPRHGPVWPRLDGVKGHAAPHNVSGAVNGWLHAHSIWHTLHTARHWFGTHTYRTTGRDLRATQELMRHRSPVSTAIYTFVDPGGLSTAVDALPSPTRRLRLLA